MRVPDVHITQMLTEALVADGYDVEDYRRQFRKWKTDWDREEFCFWFFGKDGYYKFPLRDGKQVMRHVHLPPETAPDAKRFWTAQFRRKGMKTSNTALVYAGDKALNRYLLIYVLAEPDGHKIADMLTPDDAELMNSLTDQAAEYIDTGRVYL